MLPPEKHPLPRNGFHMQDGRPVYDGHTITMPAHWRRLFALWVDSFVIWLIFGSVLNGIWDGSADVWLKWTTCWIGTGICFMIINGWHLVKHGQTLGKMWLKLRIVHVDMRPATWQRLLLRYGLFLLYMVLPWICILVFMFDALFALRPTRRSLHDILAGTAVIQILEPVEPETTP